MCQPDYYDTHFLFNPWMDYREQVNKKRARVQWQNLKKTIEKVGGKVELISPDWAESAMLFVRDNALIFDFKKVLILRSYGPRGKREPKLLAKWFKKNGWNIYFLPKGLFLEGGNMVFLDSQTILAGWKVGESLAGYQWLVNFLKKQKEKEVKLILLKLINKKYLHLDMVFSPLKNKGFLIYPAGLNLGKNWKKSSLWRNKPVIELENKEYFGANLIVVKDTIISSTFSSKTEKKLQKMGFKTKKVDLSEFHKAGGGAHCLTLELNPSLTF